MTAISSLPTPRRDMDAAYLAACLIALGLDPKDTYVRNLDAVERIIDWASAARHYLQERKPL